MKNLVVISGAGISAESGLNTFRDSNGLWENHRIEDVATPEAFAKDPELVLRFYNMRRQDAAKAQPNAAHMALVELGKAYNVHIVTQNVDDLHERAGSKNVLHLHGQLNEAKGQKAPYTPISIGTKNISLGDLAPDGTQLRPNIVWFGEAVPLIEPAIELCKAAEVLIIVGTSLQVYPAAGLVTYAAKGCKIYVVDPKANELSLPKSVTIVAKKATEGLQELLGKLL